MNKKDDDWIERSNRKITEIAIAICVSFLTTILTLYACGVIGR